MAYISFEEVKEILKESIDETTNINEALEKTVQFIYSKGYEDGSRKYRTEQSTDVSDSCKGCPNICIMYDPNMKGCNNKMKGVQE